MSGALDPSLAAADPAVSAWVAANAGAGKTFTLANRVARLLLAEVKPERILCLTFTKAAAAEMQERLFRQLGGWAMLDDTALAAAVAGIGGAADNLPAARRLFAQALETPGGLKVLTIHAFCQLVLSRFPLEAGIAPAFEVLDEQSARALAAEARAAMLERAGGGEAALAAAVAHLVGECGEAGLNALLEAGLKNDRRRLDRFFASLGDGSVIEAARRAHQAPEEAPETLAGDFCTALRDEIARLREAAAWLDSGGSTDQARARDLKLFLATDFGPQGFASLAGLFLTGEGEPRKSLATKKLAQARTDLADLLEKLQHRFCDAHQGWRAARAASLGAASLTLLAAVRRNYERAKQARGVLDYDDLIAATLALLERKGAAAWVLYKLDRGIDHVLVDEAQDTSPEQWAILRKLTEEFFSGEGAPRPGAKDGQLRTLFAVGDEKQSIFSFQGADPALFAVNRAHFAGLAAGAGHAFLDQPLQISRRSAPEILSFVDKVFESEAAREGLTSDGHPLHHPAFRTKAPGGIEFWPTVKPEVRDAPDPYGRPLDAPASNSPVVVLAAKIAERIRDWLDRGATLPGHDAPIRPADIMILLPRRNPFGGEVIRQLKLRKVPVAGADRLVLTEQIAVMDLMALGHFVLQLEDDLNLAALLRSPLCGISEDDLFKLAQPRDGSLWNALVRRKAEFPAIHAFLAQMLALADYAPPFEFYSHALIAHGGRRKLLARLGGEAADTIDEFLSLALAHERGQTPSLQGFLDWLARGATEIKRDMERGRDEVRVMTVHGAKGLEADIVILPDTTALREPEGGQLLYDGDEVLFPVPAALAPERVRLARERAKAEWRKEHRRLLYVALTRARDRLIVCGFENRLGTRDGSWYRLAEEAASLLQMQPHEDGLGHGALAMTYAVPRDEKKSTPALPDWLLRPAPPESGPRAIRPSETVEAPPVQSPLGRGAARFRRGLVAHALLARLPEIEAERRLDLARSFAQARGFSAAEAEALAKETLAVMDDPAFAAAFGPNSQAEAGLLAELPELNARINGRIDRLAVSEDEVLILDFKTNRPPPADEDGVSAAYLRQMALYRAGAARLFPGRRIVCGLLFTDGPRLVRLSDAVLDRQWAQMLARLDPHLDREGDGS